MAKYGRFDPRNKKKNTGKGNDKASNPQDAIKFLSQAKRENKI